MNEETKKEGDETHIAIFKGKAIRRKLIGDKWFFSIVDVIRALTDSNDPHDYWYRLKKREQESSGIELSTFCRQLKLKSGDGKEYETDCADTEGIVFHNIKKGQMAKLRIDMFKDFEGKRHKE